MKVLPLRIFSVADLPVAAADGAVGSIVAAASCSDEPSFILSPGQTLVGESAEAERHFASGQDGVQLSSDNRVAALRLTADPDRRAIYNDTTISHLGCIDLQDIKVRGLVRILARYAVCGGHVEAHDVDVEYADAGGINAAEFERGVTLADDAVGIQISQPVGRIGDGAALKRSAVPGTRWSRASL